MTRCDSIATAFDAVISTRDDAIDGIDGIDAFGRTRSRWDGGRRARRRRGRTRDDGDDVPEIGRGGIQERWMADASVRQGDGTDEWERRKGRTRGEEGVRALGSDAARDDDGGGVEGTTTAAAAAGERVDAREGTGKGARGTTKKCAEDFEPLKLIGRGAFGA